jgi:hypothetical protein
MHRTQRPPFVPLAIAAALVVLLAAVIASADEGAPQTHTAARPKPLLKVWGCNEHPAALRFALDYRDDADFRSALESRYDVRLANVHGPLGFSVAATAAGVITCPTFDCPDGSRLAGYTTAGDLLDRLGIARPGGTAAGDDAGSSAPAGDATADPAAAATSNGALDQFRTEIERLQAWTRGREAADQASAEQIEAQRAALRTLAAQLAGDRTAAEIGELRNQMESLARAIEARAVIPGPAPEPRPPAPPDAGSPATLEEGTASDPRAGTDRPAGQAFLRIGNVALSLLEIASLFGLTAATGGTATLGMAAARAAICFIVRRRQAKRAAASTPPTTPATREAPAAAFTPTNFAPYSVDLFRGAYTAAAQQLSSKYPGAIGTMQTLESLIQQHLTGQQAKA